MAKIKIKDLPEDYRITQKEMAKVMGGFFSSRFTLFSPVIQGPFLRQAAVPSTPWIDSSSIR